MVKRWKTNEIVWIVEFYFLIKGASVIGCSPQPGSNEDDLPAAIYFYRHS